MKERKEKKEGKKARKEKEMSETREGMKERKKELSTSSITTDHTTLCPRVATNQNRTQTSLLIHSNTQGQIRRTAGSLIKNPSRTLCANRKRPSRINTLENTTTT